MSTTHKFKEHDVVRMTRDVEEELLSVGQQGAVVYCYPEPGVYEVEFRRGAMQGQMQMVTLEEACLELVTAAEPELKVLAEVGWTANDVRTLTNELHGELAEEWLQANAKHIQAAMTNHGWEAIRSCLVYDGIALKADEDEATGDEGNDEDDVDVPQPEDDEPTHG